MSERNITPVVQRKDGCFPAVIAMLTGIDYRLLPNVTVRLMTKDDGLKVASEHDIKASPVAEVFEVETVGWRVMQHYMRFNYGVRLSFTRKRPKVPAGRMMSGWGGAHIMVELPDGTVIDPNYGFRPSMEKASKVYFGIHPLDAWITATLL